MIVCLMPTSGLTAGETQHISTVRSTFASGGGKSYLVTFPKVWTGGFERPLDGALVVRVHGKDLSTVSIRSTVGADLPGIDETVTALDGSAEFVVPVPYLHREHGKKVKNGLWVNGDAEFSVTTFVRWEGNSESSLHLPLHALDTSYTVSSWYNDQFGLNGAEQRPAQIVVTAAENGTVVSITPTVEISAGVDLPAIGAGQTGTCTLNAGESILLQPAVLPLLIKDFASDASGTRITANKKIAVIAGHTKASVMRFPNLLPPVGPNAVAASFVRAPFHEVQLPDRMADTLFVTVPMAYGSSRITGSASADLGFDDDRGDVIRIVALHDSTMVYQCRVDGSEFRSVRRLNRGESHLEFAQMQSTIWKSSKPVHVTQYGKSWYYLGDQTTGQPENHFNGFPTMTTVPPVSRWTEYARIEVDTQDMACMAGVTFSTEDQDNIFVNGEPIAMSMRGAIRPLFCGHYSFAQHSITSPITIEARNGARFMAWTWGARDRAGNVGRAYASTAGIAVDDTCSDKLDVTHEIMECGSVRVTIQSTPSECGQLANVDVGGAVTVTTVEDTPTRRVLEVTPQDASVDQTIHVNCMTANGVRTTASFVFLKDDIVSNPHTLGLAGVEMNETSCVNMTLTNLRIGGVIPTTVARLELAHNELVNTPVFGQLASGEIRSAEVCIKRTTPQTVDTLFVVTECRRIPVTVVDFTTTSINENAVAGLEILDVRPLPVTDGEVLVNVTSREAAITQFEVTNMLGQNVTYAVGGALCPLQPGINTVRLNVASLSPGTYFVGVAGRPSTVLVVR